MGESSSSEIANTAMIASTSSAGTAFPVVPDMGTNNQNAAPMPTTPSANFRGVLGARGPSLVHRSANSGDSRMTHTGSTAPIQLDGAVQPKMLQFIRSSE